MKPVIDATRVACPHCDANPTWQCRTPRSKAVPVHAVRKAEAERVFAAIDAWNERYPLGTPVRAYPGFRPEDVSQGETVRVVETDTRSSAWLPPGHTVPVVMVEGYPAWISLSHIDVIGEAL